MSSSKPVRQQGAPVHDSSTFDLSWDYNYYDEALTAPPNNVPPVVYTGESPIIAAQPISSRPATDAMNLRVMPSTESPIRSTTSPFLTPFYPRVGLDFLYGLTSVFIQQSYELNELLSGVQSDNRFTVRGPSNEALYGVSEQSDPSDRIWGSLRPFNLSLVDRSHQEVLLFKKNLGCGFFCCFCKNQFMEVWANPGQLVGCIQQDYGVVMREIIILNADIDTVFRIPIPFLNTVHMPKETHFRIMDREKLAQKGTITRAWNVNISCYTSNIYFSDPDMDVKYKGLFLAAAFLLEYLYFQSSCC